MLKINNLHANIEGKEILKGLNLELEKGKIYAIMGPNGSGKSTLASVLAGKEKFEVTQGDIIFEGESILDKEPHERAQKGIFLAFQYPVEIPGVSMTNFIKAAVTAKRKANGLEPLKPADFLRMMKEKQALVEMGEKFKGRSVNEGLSGGEKKKNEVFQMAMLEPKLAILDETDSGLDIDALRIVANGINALKNDENTFVVITHYQRLLDYIVPDVVHVLYDGRIIKTGDKSLALELEANGYNEITENLKSL